MPEVNPCLNCNAPCEEACISNSKVPINNLMTDLDLNVRSKAEISIPADEERLGCHLCLLVCPQNAISSSKRRISRKEKT